MKPLDTPIALAAFSTLLNCFPVSRQTISFVRPMLCVPPYLSPRIKVTRRDDALIFQSLYLCPLDQTRPHLLILNRECTVLLFYDCIPSFSYPRKSENQNPLSHFKENENGVTGCSDCDQRNENSIKVIPVSFSKLPFPFFRFCYGFAE